MTAFSQQNAGVMQRVQELRTLVTSAWVELQITERDQRLVALQERWEGLRLAKQAFAKEDYEAAMKTGVVCRKTRWIGGKDGREVTEYGSETDSTQVSVLVPVRPQNSFHLPKFATAGVVSRHISWAGARND